MSLSNLHWTHRKRIKALFVEGFSLEELSIMYFPLTYLQIKQITRGLKQNERI